VARLYDSTGVARCSARKDCGPASANFLNQVNASLDSHLPLLFGTALIVIPVIIGIFWGAPLITRELETGTYRLAWNQSVSRTRWLATKLVLVGLASMAAAGLFSAMVTWSASLIDKVSMNWLQPAVFSERGIAPVGYAAFAFALAVTAGILIRRTVPAMAVTLAIFTAVQFAARALRAHLITPLRIITPISGLTGANITIRPGNAGQLALAGNVNLPGAWIYSNQIVNAAGHPVSQVPLPAGGALSVQTCGNARTGPTGECFAGLAGHGYRQLVTYQPASRFWEFQWYETAIFVALAAVLAGFCFWWIRNRVS
jgi:ABC-2 family transporter protein